MEAARQALIAGIAVCGLAVVVLSILPWVTFENRREIPDIPAVSASFSGLDLSRSRDLESIFAADAPHPDGWCSCDVTIGDGFFTAALGLLLVASAGIAQFGGRYALGGAAAAAAAIPVVALAGYNAAPDWSAIVFEEGFPVTTDGTVQPALYALIVVAVIAAIDGSATWAISRSPELTGEEVYDDEDDESEEEGQKESNEAWA